MLPPKGAYRMADLVALTGIPARRIRFWISQGWLPRAVTRGAGQFPYTQAHIDAIKARQAWIESAGTLPEPVVVHGPPSHWTREDHKRLYSAAQIVCANVTPAVVGGQPCLAVPTRLIWSLMNAVERSTQP